MLSLFFGMPSADFTAALAKELLARREGSPCLVLVPEQFSVTTERRLLEAIGDSFSLWVEVLSFRRLPDFIFDRLGGRTAPTLSEGGMRILLSGLTDRHRADLKAYGPASLRADFVELLRSQFREFAAYETDPDDLMDLADRLPKGDLKNCLHDLALLYTALKGEMERLRGAEFALSAAADRLFEEGSAAFFAGYDIFLWHFKGFTPQEMTMIERMLQSGAQVTVALLGEDGGPPADELDALHSVRLTAEQLRRLALETGAGQAPDRTLPERADKPKVLQYLEEALLHEDLPPFAGDASAVRAAVAETPAEEAEFVAAEMARLLRQGVRPREMAVIVRDAPRDAALIETAFSKFGLPVQLDRRGVLADKPLPALLLAALTAVLGGYRCDDVLAFLKTGLAGLDRHEVDRLEVYVSAWSIRGSRWKLPFTWHPQGFESQWSERDRRELFELEQLRLRAVAPLMELEEAVKEGGARPLSLALCRLLEAVGAEAATLRAMERHRAAGDEAAALELESVWDSTMELLEQLEALAGPEVSARRYAELLRLAASKSRIGIIPATVDQVLVLGADRVLPGMVRHAFVMDFSDDLFPRPPAENGLLSGADKLELAAGHIRLAPSGEEEALEERYYAYLALMAGSESLTLTHSRRAAEERRPSPWLLTLRRLLPGMEEVEIDRWREQPTSIQAPLQAAERLLTLPQDHPLRLPLLEAVEGDPALAERCRLLSAAALRAEEDPVFSRPAVARRLYQGLTLSPTSLERYAQCPFSYFLGYGLRLKSRRRHEMDALQRGTFLHHVMERFLKDLAPELRTTMSEQQAKERVDAIVRDYLTEHMPDFNEREARFRALFLRLSRILYHTVGLLLKELRESDFVPVDYELVIGEDVPELVIGEGEEAAHIRGKVDRVDLLEKDGKRYLRIVDYKSSKKDIRYAELYQGIGQQMLLYLRALLQNGKDRYGEPLLPAGVVYAPVQLEVTSCDDRSISESGLQKERRTKQNGLLLDDEEVLRAMDHSGCFYNLPVSIDRKGEISPKTSALATREELGLLWTYMEGLLADIAARVRGGAVPIDPVTSGANGADACKFCEMRAVCRHEGEPRLLPRLTAEQFWDSLRRETAGKTPGRKEEN